MHRRKAGTVRWRNLLPVLGILVAASLVSMPAMAREKDVERWVEKDLANYLARELAGHPRFKSAPLRFVVARNGTPVANVDRLSLQLRDDLQRAVVDTPGITVAWQPGDLAAHRVAAPTTVDCSADEAQYIIALEVRATGKDEAEVSVRALDAVENSWVSGFGKQWQGRLSRRQWRLAQQPASDRTFLGQRSVPYEQTETDLVAAHLAHDLRCELMRQVSGEYVVAPEKDGSDERGDSVLDLVSKNITGLSSLQIAVDELQANALLQGQAHLVDGDLHQYWITITPTDTSDDLQPISTSVYVKVPQRFMSAVPASSSKRAIELQSGAIFESLRLVKLESSSACPRRQQGFGTSIYASRRADCLALEINTHDDAVVFVLNHQQNNGLVRMADEDCDYRTAARISRAGEPMTVALPTSMMLNSWLPENEWRLEPDADTYYAIAVSNSRAARAISSHLDNLPRRCSESLRVGYEGPELQRWLQTLSSELERWQPYVDWNAIRIRNVY